VVVKVGNELVELNGEARLVLEHVDDVVGKTIGAQAFFVHLNDLGDLNEGPTLIFI